jgi:hypothetical protein
MIATILLASSDETAPRTHGSTFVFECIHHCFEIFLSRSFALALVS